MTMKKLGYLIAVGIMVGALGFSWSAEAGSKELEAQKRGKFEDDSVVSVSESIERQQREEAAFQKALLESNREMVGLLKEIKGVLEEMKATDGQTAGAVPPK